MFFYMKNFWKTKVSSTLKYNFLIAYALLEISFSSMIQIPLTLNCLAPLTIRCKYNQKVKNQIKIAL